MRAVLLGRVSTKKASQTHSLERQRAELRALAREKGWSVAGWFEDRTSGKTLARPGLTAALEVLLSDRADVLVVNHLDRLGRNTREMLETIDALHAAQKSFVVKSSPFDTTTAVGRLQFTWFAAFAEYIRSQGSERILAGLAHARRHGRVGGRPRSLDYSLTPRARALRQKGASWTKIAGELGGTRGAWSRALTRSVAKPPPIPPP